MDDSPDSRLPQSDMEVQFVYEQVPAKLKYRRLSSGEDEYEGEQILAKPRALTNSEDDRSDAEDDDEEEEEPEDDEDDVEEKVFRPASKARISFNAAGRPPETGIITRIYVENFMCHRRFELSLCRNVNFITGQNGSGKSAILAAIQICLGAEARKTNRARNLRDLVRKDATTNAPTYAKVQVTLLNSGEDAFKPDDYGETITVERTISLRSGFNGYRLLDINRKEVSRSKKELLAMLDWFNIMVENPVAVLDQEEAKKFLKGKAEDKYNFFTKATELARIRDTCLGTADKIEELDGAMSKAKATANRKREHVRELKRAVDDHGDIDDLRELLVDAQANYGWAYFNASEQQHDACVAQLQEYEEKVAEKEQQLSEIAKPFGDPDEEETRRNNLHKLTEEAQKQAKLKMNLEQELRSLVAPMKQLERRQNALTKERKFKEKALDLARERLRDVRDEILTKEDSVGSGQARRIALLKELEEKLVERKGKKDELCQEMGTNFRKFQETEPHAKDAAALVCNGQQQIRAMEGKLESLEASSSDSLAVFGAKVRHVHRLVENAKRGRKFRGPVVGPIGAHVTICPGKEEFAAVAEHAIGGMKTLDRFIVTNDADRVLLQSIRDQAECEGECAIFQINNNSRYNIAGPPEGVETVATVLKVENPLVFNALVDFSRIDQRAICRNRESSEQQLLCKNAMGEDTIRGVIKEVFFLPDGSMWTVKNGARAVFSNSKKLRKTIGADKSAALVDLKAALEEKRKELAHIRRKEACLAHESITYQRNWNAAKKAMLQNGQEIDSLTSEIEMTRAELDEDENNAIDTAEFEQDVSDAEKELELLEEEFKHIVEEIEDCAPAIEQKEALLEECCARNDKVLQDMSAAGDELTQLVESKSQRESQLEKKRQKLDKYHAAIEKIRARELTLADDKRSNLEKARTLAYRLNLQKQYRRMNRGERDSAILRQEPTASELTAIEVKRVPKEIDFYETKIHKLKEKIEKKERRIGIKDDAAVVFEKHLRASREYKESEEYAKQLGDRVGELHADMLARRYLWKKLLRHLARTSAVKFDELLSLNGYSGKIEFHHGNETLDVRVNKESAKASMSGDAKSLSGGESSYTTMCLLLALGEELETPFRIMDEYDVFMDDATRKLTTKMLVHLATTKMVNRQFIFITPQNLSWITQNPQVKLLKFKPPQRRGSHVVGGPSQSTLDFSRHE